MFGFIRTAYTAIKESFKSAYVTTKQACKSAYTKIRNFFFDAPIEKEKVEYLVVNGRNYGALSHFVDPLSLNQPRKPTESLSIISNKNGIPVPFSSQIGRFKRNPQPLNSINQNESAQKSELPRVPGPFSPETMRFTASNKLSPINNIRRVDEVKPIAQVLKERQVSIPPKTTVSENHVLNSTIASAKTVSEPNKPFIPVVSSKDLFDPVTLQALREKAPEDFVAAPRQISEPTTVTTVAAAPEEERTVLGGPGAFMATVALCDDLGAAIDQALKDRNPQQAFNSVVESVSGLFWGAFGSTTNNKPTHVADGWAADRATSKPKLNLNQKH